MYGKLVLAGTGAYVLQDQIEAFPDVVAIAIMTACGIAIAVDLYDDKPHQRISNGIDNLIKRFGERLDQAEAKRVAREIERKQLDANHGLLLAEELQPEDRKWLLDQAAEATRGLS